MPPSGKLGIFNPAYTCTCILKSLCTIFDIQRSVYNVQYSVVIVDTIN